MKKKEKWIISGIIAIILEIMIIIYGYLLFLYWIEWNNILIFSILSISIIVSFVIFLGFMIDLTKRVKRELTLEKWEKENIKTEEEKKRNLKIHKKETKKYHGIEYILICLENNSGMKWVVLESEFKGLSELIYNLNENMLTGELLSIEDFLWYDSGIWNKKPIEYQWNKMDKIAKQEIDQLYEIYEHREEILNNKITHLKEIISNLENFIMTIKGGE